MRCINLAKRGMIVLNVEWIGMGQLSTPGFTHYRMNQLDLCGTSGIAPFSLELGVSYDSLLSGGLVVPGNPDSSELIRRLEGTSGQRMPLNATPLPDDQIQMFRQWISAGAPNDTN